MPVWNPIIMGSSEPLGDLTSFVFDGTGDYFEIPDHADFNFGAADYTVECWFRLTTLAYSSLVEQFDYTGTAAQWATSNFEFLVNGSNKLVGRVSNGSTGTQVTSTTSVSVNTWHHAALVRDSATLRLFLDGTQEATATAVTQPDSNRPLWIGQDDGTNANNPTGNIDEIRISTAARYTGNFTPSTEQFTSDANTVLLFHCGEVAASGTPGTDGWTVVDSGNTGHTATGKGNANQDTSVYKI